jgi:23S rRNA (adenine2030-N6)-methyltransferase
MNYRHVFHAGNHADVFKHAALTLLLEHLLQKPQPFAVLDTHAGVGLYDLASEGAQKTREYEAGVARVFGQPLAAAPRYAELIAEMNPQGLASYPGSPEITRRLMRDGDRLICCELHPAEFEALKARYRGDRRIAVHHRDGYEAMGALLPPPERRGLVLIDPPYEVADETERLVQALGNGLRRWPTGVFCIWYPIKDRRIADLLALSATAAPWPKALRAELSPFAADETSLPGGGLIICNTPWKLDAKLTALCEDLGARLGTGHGGWRVDWLTPG